MSYCTQCGKQLVEGEAHACQTGGESQAAFKEISASTVIGTSSSTAPKFKFDSGLILNLLRNPMSSSQLQPGKDYVYGIIGLAASVIGFFLWAWALQKELFSSISSIFGFMGILDGLGSKITSHFFLTGILSLAALIGTLWVLGNWKGERKLHWKEVVTYFGSMQLLSGAAFLGSAIICFISIPLSLILILINLLSTLLLTVMQSHELFQITYERRMAMVLLSVSLYVVLLAVIMNISM